MSVSSLARFAVHMLQWNMGSPLTDVEGSCVFSLHESDEAVHQVGYILHPTSSAPNGSFADKNTCIELANGGMRTERTPKQQSGHTAQSSG